jgi:hypothetical protein
MQNTRVVCAQCDLTESKCACDRYCCYCQGHDGVRLCVDGIYYCPECREACEVRLAESNDK